jgi:hypothetical protein
VLCDFEDVFYEVPAVVDESDSKELFLLCLQCARILVGYRTRCLKTRPFRPVCERGNVFAESLDEPVPGLVILTFNDSLCDNPALIVSIPSDG